ncbi:MAG TPA: hypothetical protein IAB26_14275 [Candidatus Limivivens merdigallinarum]|uniref:DUF7666 domain-containing protein n=2 Tax=Lachnospiraceae TaxID=186803 RepID=A0A9D0ZXA1_9FIRM|nr:hypothetical protein [Candidatus Limivivens merdigallinarum]HIZ21744.1 hypothetical protein [Candidatus Blautia faecigallinarum]
MIAYKGLKKDLTCLGYQFLLNQVNITDQANCAENGFHCAENPLDCLCYYRDWRKSVYFLVKAEGDLDEDSVDSKISCTRITLLKELSFQMLLLHGLAYMARHPGRKWCSIVKKEEGRCWDGYVVVRGKHPKASGSMGDILALAKEEPDSQQIQEVALYVVDGKQYKPHTWYGVDGKA